MKPDLEIKLDGVYRTRDGHIVRIVQSLPLNDTFKFKADDGTFYTEKSRIFLGRKSKKDLIAEISDDPIVDNVLIVRLKGYPNVQKIVVELPPNHRDVLVQINKGIIKDSYFYKKDLGIANDD